MSSGAKWALAQLDPFHPLANGAKIPDSNTQPSIAISDNEQGSLTTAAVAGLNAMAFRPAYSAATILATSGVAAVTWPAAYAGSTNRAKGTAYAAAVELTRATAHAVRLSCSLAPTTTTGFVHIAISTESLFAAATWQYPTTTALMSGCQYYKRVTLASLTQTPFVIINKYLDDTAFRYTSPVASPAAAAANPEFHTDLSWGTIIVMVEGAPISSLALSFEHILLSEAIPQTAGPILGTSAAEASPGTLSAVSSASAGTEPFHTEEDTAGYVQRGISALATGAAREGEAVFREVAVPLIEKLGERSVNAAAGAFMRMAGVGGISGVNSNPARLSN